MRAALQLADSMAEAGTNLRSSYRTTQLSSGWGCWSRELEKGVHAPAVCCST